MEHFLFRCVWMNKLLRHLIVVGLVLWSWCAPPAGQALAEESLYAAAVEHEVKAAFIHNFTKFIDWPPEMFEDENSPLRIGILGTGSIDNFLMNLNGRKVQKRPLEVSRVKNFNEVSQYHVIFVNPSEKGRMQSILRALKGTGILTIGDTTGFAGQCGIINFYLKSGKVRFEINIEASRRENLQISSKLLRLARIVNSQCD
jgi:YfiR/HmsC-like